MFNLKQCGQGNLIEVTFGGRATGSEEVAWELTWGSVPARANFNP